MSSKKFILIVLKNNKKFFLLLSIIFFIFCLRVTVKKVIYFYVTGKSAGHIIPLQTIHSQQNVLDNNFLFFSTATKIDRDLIPQGIFFSLNSSPQKINGIYNKVIWTFKALWYSFLFFFYAFIYRPNKIRTTGGYLSVVCIIPLIIINQTIGWFIPYFKYTIEIYHLDTVVGAANKTLMPFAESNYYCCEEVKNQIPLSTQKKISFPVRFNNSLRDSDKNGLRKKYGISKEKKIIFILGGSQGSNEINEKIDNFFNEYNMSYEIKKKLFIIHQYGSSDIEKVKKTYDTHDIEYYFFSYQKELNEFYTIADYVITRGGSSALHECIFFNKKTFVIPLRNSTDDHQIRNAQEFQKDNLLITVYDSANDDFNLKLFLFLFK